MTRMSKIKYLCVFIFILISFVFIQAYKETFITYFKNSISNKIPEYLNYNSLKVKIDGLSIRVIISDVFIDKDISSSDVIINVDKLELELRLIDIIINQGSKIYLNSGKVNIYSKYQTNKESFVHIYDEVIKKIITNISNYSIRSVCLSDIYIYYNSKDISASLSNVTANINIENESVFTNKNIINYTCNTPYVELKNNKNIFESKLNFSGYSYIKNYNHTFSKIDIIMDSLKFNNEIILTNTKSSFISKVDIQNNYFDFLFSECNGDDISIKDLNIHMNLQEKNSIISGNYMYASHDLLSKIYLILDNNLLKLIKNDSIMISGLTYSHDSKIKEYNINFNLDESSLLINNTIFRNIKGSVNSNNKYGEANLNIETNNIITPYLNNIDTNIVSPKIYWKKNNKNWDMKVIVNDFNLYNIQFSNIEIKSHDVLNTRKVKIKLDTKINKIKNLLDVLNTDNIPSILHKKLRMMLNSEIELNGNILISGEKNMYNHHLYAEFDNYNFQFDEYWPLVSGVKGDINYNNGIVDINLKNGKMLDVNIDKANTSFDIFSDNTYINMYLSTTEMFEKVYALFANQAPLVNIIKNIPLIKNKALFSLNLFIPLKSELNMGFDTKIKLHNNDVIINNMVRIDSLIGDLTITKNKVPKNEENDKTNYYLNLLTNGKIHVNALNNNSYFNSDISFILKKEGINNLKYTSKISIDDIKSNNNELLEFFNNDYNTEVNVYNKSDNDWNIKLSNSLFNANFDISKDINNNYKLIGKTHHEIINDKIINNLKLENSNILFSEVHVKSSINSLHLYNNTFSNVMVGVDKNNKSFNINLNSNDLRGQIKLENNINEFNFKIVKLDNIPNLSLPQLSKNIIKIAIDSAFLNNIDIGKINCTVSLDENNNKQVKGTLLGKDISEAFKLLDIKLSSIYTSEFMLQYNLKFIKNYKDIKGSLNISAGKGYLTTVRKKTIFEKLWSLINLEKLPKRLYLDFRDLSEDYHFNNISGQFSILNQSLFSNKIIINSDEWIAKINMKYNMLNTNLDAKINIYPEVLGGLPMIGAVALTPAFGAAILLTNKIFDNNIKNNTIISFLVKGKIDNLEINKV